MAIAPVVSAQPPNPAADTSTEASTIVETDSSTVAETDASIAAEPAPSNASESESGPPEPAEKLSKDPVDMEISDDSVNPAEDENDSAQDSWVDDIYDATNEAMHGFVFEADDFIGEEQEEDLPTLTRSRFNFAIESKIEDKGGLQHSIDLDLRADIRLPRTKERFGLFISTSAPEELPGEDPEEVENPLLIGLELISAFRRVPYLRSFTGVRVNLSPAFFAGMVFQPQFDWSVFHIIPQQKVFWFSDETGFGGLTSFRVDWLPREELLLRSFSAARYTEATDGIEGEQSFLIAFSSRGTFKNLDRGHGIKFSAFAHKSGSFIMDSYRIAYIYRRNIFKKWLFIQLGPEVNFYNEEDWDASPGFRFGLDVLFWTPEELDV